MIPAHNEGQVIGRLLRGLLGGEQPADLNIIVIANDCADNTAEIAHSFGQRVRVLRLPVASKRLALSAGDKAATGFPRVYVDADVEVNAADIEALAAELRKPGVLAAAPERVLALEGCPWPVRWYYDIWSRLPEVRGGLFGRGVVAVSEEGHRRIAELPPLLADDLAASLAFTPDERRVVQGATVTCYPPRNLAGLLRQRIRAVTGVAQVERTEHAPSSTARTKPADLLSIFRHGPSTAPKLALFMIVAIIARLGARRAIASEDYTTWLRDDSSRLPRPRAADRTAASSQEQTGQSPASARGS